MALFKHKEFFEHSDDAAFDRLIAPNTDVRGREFIAAMHAVTKLRLRWDTISHPKTTTNMPEE